VTPTTADGHGGEPDREVGFDRVPQVAPGVLGDVAFTVDGEPVDFTERVTWRGIMINGLPNMAYVSGYFRHSWTLRVDLVSDLVGRLLAHMQDQGSTMAVPTLRPQDTDMQLRAWSAPPSCWPATRRQVRTSSAVRGLFLFRRR
jgi:cation diffusion facilitator CzcD-associated flavoprotein CzcO